MTDKELLEYAAKAAGYTDIQYEDGWWLEVRYGLTEAFWNGEDYWNPLEDNDDAFRLAVKLTVIDGYQVRIPHVDDENQYAAARRAIVKAAAEIGKEQA
jgi:hypothetical protein